MTVINKDTPCLFITTVARNRLPVFRTDALKGVACRALNEARRSGGFALFAYVIMPEHLHVLADGTLKASETLRYINGILSHRVIGYLKEGGFTASLQKLRAAPKDRRHEYSLVDHHSNAVPVFSESFHAEGELHSPEPGAGRTGGAGGRLSLVERAVLAGDGGEG